MYSPSVQAIQDVDEFLYTQNRFWEMYYYITCSPMDSLQWMGAIRMRVQTADKNITSNPQHSSPPVNVLKAACL